MTTVKADPQAVLNGILALNLSECTVTVCLASCPKDEVVPRFERLLLSEALTEVFRSVIAFVLEQYKKESGSDNLVLREYVVGSKPDAYEIEHLDLSAYELVKDQIDPLSSLVDLAVFDADEQFISNLRFYVIVIEPPNAEPVYFFRSYTPKRMLGRSRVFAMIFSSGVYDRVTEPMFLFDHFIDCVSRGAMLFVLKKENFQELFRFFEMVRKVARETLDSIKVRVPIQNFDEFARDCEGHLAKLMKLKNIAGKSYWGKITMNNIKNVIERHNLPVQVVEANGKQMLRYDPTNKWVLLKLLDDDYLWSQMTEQSYEVTGKRELEQD